VWPVVASVQQTVALLSTEQPFEQRLANEKCGGLRKKGAMLPALAGCWKRYPAKGPLSALLSCVEPFFCVFPVR